jgi:cell division transport system permease protein
VTLDRIWAAGPEARLLPAEKLHGPTLALTAIMTFAMIVIAAAGLSLAHAASVVTSGVHNKYVVQLPAAEASALPKLVARGRSLPGVLAVTAVPESEMRRTLERWLGSAASNQDLPIPAMATLDLAPGADVAGISSALREQVPEAAISAESAELEPLLGSLRGLQWLAVSLVTLMAAATAAAIVLAARGALDTHRGTVEIMHGIGATDAQVVRLFERKIAIDSIVGALIGSAAAAGVMLLLGGGIAAAVGDLASAPLTWFDVIVLAAIPITAVAIAVAVAHRTLLGALRVTL